MFKVGDRVEYIDDGELGTVIEIDRDAGGPDFGILWADGDESWAEEEDLRHADPLAKGDVVTLTAEVVSVGVDGKTAMVRIEGMTESYFVPIAVAFMARKGCPTS